MSADERLVVILEARISEFERRMRQAEQRGTKTYHGLSRDSRSATRAMEADMLRSTGRINTALASTSARIGGLQHCLLPRLPGRIGRAAPAGGKLADDLGAGLHPDRQQPCHGHWRVRRRKRGFRQSGPDDQRAGRRSGPLQRGGLRRQDPAHHRRVRVGRKNSRWLDPADGESEVFQSLIETMGITEDGQSLNPDVRAAEGKIAALEKDIAALQAQIENNTEMGFDNTEAIARLREVRAELAAIQAAAANLPRYVGCLRPDGTAIVSNMDTGSPITGYERPPMPANAEPISIADHPAGGTAGGGGGRGRRGRSGGDGGRAVKAQQDDHAKEIEATRERTAALQAEAAALVAVAASGKDYGDAL